MNLLQVVYLQLLTKKLLIKFQNFVQTICYSKIEDESVTERRVRIYKQLKTKTSQIIPPDKNFKLQAIKQIHYQSYYWLRLDIAVIPETDLSENGWMIVEGNVQQVWFVGKDCHLI